LTDFPSYSWHCRTQEALAAVRPARHEASQPPRDSSTPPATVPTFLDDEHGGHRIDMQSLEDVGVLLPGKLGVRPAPAGQGISRPFAGVAAIRRQEIRARRKSRGREGTAVENGTATEKVDDGGRDRGENDQQNQTLRHSWGWRPASAARTPSP